MDALLSVPVIGWLAALAICAASSALGVGVARRAGLLLFAGLMLAGGVERFAPAPWGPALACLVGLALLVALASLAWKPKARWPLVLVALQGLTLALHVLSAVEPRLRLSTAPTATWIVRGVMLVTLAHAAATSRREGRLSS